MKCNNKKVVGKIPLLYFLIVAGLFATNLIGYQNTVIHPNYSGWLFAAPSLFLLGLFFYFYKNAQYFEFDAAGEVIILMNRGTFLSNFILYRGAKAEFPKSKLKFYGVKDFFFYKTLYVYIESNHLRTKKLSFNITFLNYKKQKLVLNSLSEISEKNKGTLHGHRKYQ